VDLASNQRLAEVYLTSALRAAAAAFRPPGSSRVFLLGKLDGELGNGRIKVAREDHHPRRNPHEAKTGLGFRWRKDARRIFLKGQPPSRG